MEERGELWLMTTVSILGACGAAHLMRRLINILLSAIDLDKTATSSYLRKRKQLQSCSEFINAAISNFMLVVGTYEKCLLIGKDFVFEYYSTTLVLNVIYSYILAGSSPNPVSCIIKYWDQLVMKQENITEENLNNNNNINDSHQVSKPSQYANGVRRRGGDSSSVELTVSSEGMTTSQKRKAHDSVWTFFKLSGPSLLGQFLGLHAAIHWLHVAWDGYLTSHHVTNTGLLRDCIICLQTGPLQGFVIEAAITFFFAVFIKWLSNLPQDGAAGFISRSFFITACLQSVVMTTVLYIFIKVTGAFANPLLAYALERECLYDVTTIINHIFVYVLGALAGTIAFKVIPPTKHNFIVFTIIILFGFLYFFVPNILNSDLFFF